MGLAVVTDLIELRGGGMNMSVPLSDIQRTHSTNFSKAKPSISRAPHASHTDLELLVRDGPHPQQERFPSCARSARRGLQARGRGVGEEGGLIPYLNPLPQWATRRNVARGPRALQFGLPVRPDI